MSTVTPEPKAAVKSGTQSGTLNPLLNLTLELSGGAAVRLNDMLDGCDAACSGDNDRHDGRTS
jgi:hypothetical protein